MSKPKPDKPLNARQQRFVDAYNGNATEAARKAGYTGKDQTLYVTASELLRNPKVAAAIKSRRDAESSSLIASRQDRQKFWTDVMQDDMADMQARLKASELLGKSEADFVDRHQLAGPDGGAVALIIDMGGK